MTSLPRIRTPLIQRWHRFRQQLLPVLCFVGCWILALYLWDRQSQYGDTVGVVEAERVPVRAGVAGTLLVVGGPENEGRTWAVADRINKGQFIARFDDKALLAEKATLEAEREQFLQDIEVEKERVRLQKEDFIRQHSRDVMNARTQYLESSATMERLSAEISVIEHDKETLESRLQRWSQNEEGFPQVTEEMKKNVEAQIQRQEQLIEGTQKELEATKRQMDAARTKLQELGISQTDIENRGDDSLAPMPSLPDTEKLIAGLQEQVAVHQKRIEEINLRLDSLNIYAPISGTITNVTASAGMKMQPVDEILEIAADTGRYVVSYVREELRLNLRDNMKVELRRREPGSPRITTEIERVGPKGISVPTNQLRDQATLEWAQLIRIRIPESSQLQPGEKVDVIFRLARRDST